MPCYMRGNIVIRDIDRLNQVARPMGLNIIEDFNVYRILNQEGELIGTFNKDGFLGQKDTLIKNIFREYNIYKVKMAAQKKGWKVSNIDTQNDKIVIKLRE